MKYEYLAIEGNIGAGKTSLSTRLSERYNTRFQCRAVGALCHARWPRDPGRGSIDALIEALKPCPDSGALEHDILLNCVHTRYQCCGHR